MSSTGEYARLETTGRRTGRVHSVIVRYVMYGGKMAMFPQTGAAQDWVKNLMVNPGVNVYAGGSRWAGQAKLSRVAGVDDPLLGAFQRKYGEAEVRRRYWGQRQYVEVSLSSGTAEEMDELVYADLEVAFDGVASSYDEHILGNLMNLWLRNRSVELLTQTFVPGSTILEVGCGTGTETLQLARKGINVVASDISGRMLAVMMDKARREGLEGRVFPIHCRPYELKREVKEAGFDSLDGAYSTYGAVNTEPRLGQMMENLHALIRARGKLVLGVWNRFCLYEIAGYAYRMNPAMMVARLRNPVPVGRSRFCVTTNSYSVGSLDRIVSKWFKLEGVRGVEILLPPSNLVRYLPPRRLLRLVEKFDVALEGLFPWNRLGDHFLAVYESVGGHVEGKGAGGPPPLPGRSQKVQG